MTIDQREWLETDGLGGFASGTASGIRTRRYHALLVHATMPPAGRMVLVNGFDAWAVIDGAAVDLSTQRYVPDVLYPDGVRGLESFEFQPWPRWRWRVNDALAITQEVFMVRGSPQVVIRWSLEGTANSATLHVRPFLSGRDYHSLHHENPAFDFTPRTGPGEVAWRPYHGVPGVRCRFNGRYSHQPEWYRQFLYLEERARGLDDVEDLASPGILEWDLGSGDAVCVFDPASETTAPESNSSILDVVTGLRRVEKDRRAAFPSRLHFSADQYLVARGGGLTVVAGYPWFTDWGRDTFISLRGLCIAGGRLSEARDILLEWSGAVSEGMLPNRFPDAGAAPEFNAVDASLWFIVAVQDLLRASARRRVVRPADRRRLLQAVENILRGFAAGTRFGIRADRDGLLAAGVPGVQLTWMDAKVGDDVITPRIGKPVDVQALWLNALAFAGEMSPDWRSLFKRATDSFLLKFWNAESNCLYDVVDVDHVDGRLDASLRPNQLLAVGGLPVALVTGERARAIVDVVERELVTPVGVRSLGRSEAGYVAHYEGGPSVRDRAYHQGTVWPWLMGAFVDAWIRVRGGTADATATATERFIEPVLQEMERQGLGHLYEIADAEAPFTPRGCPFQAWSVGELLRLNVNTASTRRDPAEMSSDARVLVSKTA